MTTPLTKTSRSLGPRMPVYTRAAAVAAESVARAFTPREEQVVDLLRTGLTNDQIGSDLGISTETVKRHLTNMFDKSGCDTRTQLALSVDGKELAEARQELVIAKREANKYRKLYEGLIQEIGDRGWPQEKHPKAA
jgi:DNA-binding CsgD family transcriptional regulator